MLVDDNKLEKKNVNLYEPVCVMLPEWRQPVELLVNKVTKDRVAGSTSAPKHKKTEVSLTTAEPLRLTPRETAQVQ